MTLTQAVEPRIIVLKLRLDEKFLEAARFLIEARRAHGAAPGEPSLGNAISEIAEDAARSQRYDQLLAMIDDPDVKPHLRREFTSKRSAYAEFVR